MRLPYLCALCEFFVPFVVDKIAADQKRHLHAVHAITIVTQTGIGGIVDIGFNNSAVTTDVIGIDFLFGNHLYRKKSVKRLPRFRLDREMGLVDELKTNRFFCGEPAKLL